MRITNLFRLSYWLDSTVLDQRAGAAMWLVVVVGALWCGITLALLLRRRIPRDVAIAQIIAGALLAAVGIGRLYAIPLLGLRVGWLIAGAVAVAPLALLVVRGALQDGLIADGLRAAAFGAPSPRTWSIVTGVAWIGMHLLGLAAVLSITRMPIWLAPIIIIVISAANLLRIKKGDWRLETRDWARGRWLQKVSKATDESPISNLQSPLVILHSLICVPSLAPLTFVYAVLGLRLLVSAVSRIAGGSFNVVEPFGALLNLPLALIVMTAYSLIVSLREAGGARITTDARFVRLGALLLCAGVVAWAIWTALTLHTHGVSGSDPYAYTQMGVDLAEHGTVYHSFPLIRLTYALNIPSEPIIHIGYRLPQDVQRMATTVWPPGYAAFTALAYRVAGEQGIYLITPLLSLLSLVAVVWLAKKMSDFSKKSDIWMAVVALAVFFTATSYQQVEWQLIPMADIAAQLFSILALALALHARSLDLTGLARPVRSVALFAALSGMALSIAFDVRYTQVLIAPALAFALYIHDRAQPLARRWLPVIVCAVAALVAVAPVLIYHTLAFGSPLHTGSEELTNFSLQRLPETVNRLMWELTSAREFGLLLPLIALGGIVLWRTNRRAMLTLIVYTAPLFVLHIAYAYLRPRDILSLFPIPACLAALGTAWLVHHVVGWSASRPWRQLISVGLLVALSFAFVLRSMDTLALPVTRGFGAFGYLVREQRASFGQLAKLTPMNAVIGCSLNSGAVDLHAGRLAFRPAGWSAAELMKFVDALRAENTPVYVLDDGAEMRASLDTLRSRYHLTEIARLDMPYYFPGSGSENRKVALYRVE